VGTHHQAHDDEARTKASGGLEMFSYVPLERRIPADHPLRAIRAMTDEALALTES
jgi:hypothetical protein